jgi:broad specificity phosphatase PhoE
MELIFVRHGQPDRTVTGPARSDPPLTAAGYEQAELTARRIADRGPLPTELIVSPALRSQETARPLSEQTGLPIQTVEGLVELKMPNWDGVPQETIRRVFDESFNREPGRWWNGLDGGEAFEAFHERITKALLAVLADRGVRPDAHHDQLWTVEEPDQQIAVVTHGGTNSVAIAFLLGAAATPWEWRRLRSRHASISRLRAIRFAGEYAWSLGSFNDLEHLPPDLRTK